MNKKALTWIVVLGVLAIAVVWGIGRYNAIITAEEDVNTAWAQVENQYQRRADLIPNLVETVKGYAAHESATLEGVVAARAKATQVVVDPTNATADQMAAFQAAQGELSQALGRLMAGGAMMGIMMKGDKNLLTLQVRGDGPLQGITVTADSHGNVKGYVLNPDVDIPLKYRGKLDVGGAVGKGILNVIKDLGLKEPYNGQIDLQTGEIAEDLTYYFATSEQVPSSVGLESITLLSSQPQNGHFIG